MILHPEIQVIPYKHKYEIQQACINVLDEYNLAYFSIIIVTTGNVGIHVSNSPQILFEIIQRGYGEVFFKLISELATKNEFFLWDEGTSINPSITTSVSAIINHLLGLNNSFFLIRNWNNLQIIYNFATKTSANIEHSNIINNINTFFKLGDQAYNTLINVIKNYTGDNLPEPINNFHPFKGGTPAIRYSRNKIHTRTNHSNIIDVSFRN